LLAGRELCSPECRAPLRVAHALADELGWHEARVGAEVELWREEASAEGIAAVHELDVASS
jgi:hypothetical protein